jgi:diacylglycerol kinase family enzyme
MLERSERFVVVTNKNASKLIDEHGNLKLESEVLDPFGDKITAVLETPTEEELLESILPNDILIVCGGDGTANWVLNQIIDNNINHKTAIIPLPFGGANDIARTLYGHTKFIDIIANSYLTQAYPIEAKIEEGDSTKVIHGLGYISVGATANAAAKMNNNRDHGLQSYKRYYRALSGALLSPAMVMVNGDQGFETIFDITAQNGRMSQVLHPYNDHFFENAHQLLRHANIAQFLGRGALAMMRQEKGQIIGEGQSTTIAPLHDVYLQADGEHHPVSAGSTITIGNGSHIFIPRLKR